ncbi:MAG: DUF1848 family protein [Desulfobacteraceae bacterium]|nr:MAG: DUF1848 family protein [Desulfobacteraceae bacterium]
MPGSAGTVISASRRTDIPAFYMDWFFERIDAGVFDVVNPVNRQTRTISSRPEDIHTIVFWSKNFAPFIDMNADLNLERMGYELYLNFTINSDNPDLEPLIPGLDHRLIQLERLCSTLGPDRIAWRFDPICFYHMGDHIIRNNLDDFATIAGCAGVLGVKKCVISFVDIYQKIKKRQQARSKQGEPFPEFIDPGDGLKTETVNQMMDTLSIHDISLFLCCENDFYQHLSGRNVLGAPLVRENACIDGRLFKGLSGGAPDTRRDYGQRSTHGCRCTRSVDIGSYDIHPCSHNCFFCYANPAMDTRASCSSSKGWVK